MLIYRTQKKILVEHNQKYYSFLDSSWDSFINRPNLYEEILKDITSIKANQSSDEAFTQSILKPIVGQEVWASGVTYLRSKTARMEESKDAGGGDFYDRVYDAPRPELFFKAVASRVVGPNEGVRIRRDSNWNVPEPELTLFLSSSGKIEGYTIGNDMSSRDIEGENPLYLPQAKSYDRSAALGPAILVLEKPISKETRITLQIQRDGEVVFSDSIALSQMKRNLEELAAYLFRECSFEHGVFLMTGTGIVPPDSFTLQERDVVNISIEGIGTLTNTVEIKK